jgi:hypothetical protein
MLLVFGHVANSQGNLRKGKDHAVFFSINDYDEWDDLQWPAREVAAINKELTSKFGFTSETISNPTLEEINKKLEEYRKKKFDDDSQLFIYFSGHGYFAEDTKEGFFIPKEGKRKDRNQTSYWPFTRMKNAITNIECNHIMLVIDACYSGTFDDEIAMRGRPNSSPWEEASNGDWKNYIKAALEKNSRLVLTSSEKERTPDYSIFAKRLLESLQDAAANKDILSFEQLADEVKAITPKPHSASFDGHVEGGTFLFFPKGFEETRAPTKRDSPPTASNDDSGNKPTNKGNSGTKKESKPPTQPQTKSSSNEPAESSQENEKSKKEGRGKKILSGALDILAGSGSSTSGIQTERLNEFVFTLKSCEKAGSGIDFVFEVKSENQDRQLLVKGGTRSVIRDEKGFKFDCSGIKLGNAYETREADEKLVKDVPYTLTLNYRDVTSNPQKIALMELHVWTKETSWQVLNFRNVNVKQ